MTENKNKEHKKLNKVMLSIVLLVMFLALALNSNANIDCNLTVPSTIGTGSEINVLTNISGTSWDITTAFYMRSASTANSSFILLGNVTNTSRLVSVNITMPPIQIFTLEPATDYQVYATCYGNATDGSLNIQNSTISTGITLDRGDIPTTPTSVSPSGTQGNRTLDITSTVNGANTTGCTLNFGFKNPGSSSYAMTHSGNSCTQSIAGVAEGTYVYTITATDGTNNSAATAESSIEVELTTSTSRKKAIAASLGGGSSKQQVARGLAIAQDRASVQGQKGISNAQIQMQKAGEKIKAKAKEEARPKEIAKTAGGAVAGGIIGTMVFPVVGTGIGALIGGIIGVAV